MFSMREKLKNSFCFVFFSFIFFGSKAPFKSFFKYYNYFKITA